MALTEAEFRTHCDAALDRLNRALDVVAENYDAEIVFQNGVLSIEIEDPNPARSGSRHKLRASNSTGRVRRSLLHPPAKL